MLAAVVGADDGSLGVLNVDEAVDEGGDAARDELVSKETERDDELFADDELAGGVTLPTIAPDDG